MAKIDSFLKNKAKIALPKKDLDIPRIGATVTVTGLTYDDYVAVQEMSKLKNAKSFQDIDPFRMQLETVMIGLVDPKPSELQQLDERFATPKEAVKGVFSVGEIALIANEIVELSGFGGDIVSDLKNE